MLLIHSAHPPGTTPDSDSDARRLDTARRDRRQVRHAANPAGGNQWQAAITRKPLLHGNTHPMPTHKERAMHPVFPATDAQSVDSKM
jgi:hypothetical protein